NYLHSTYKNLGLSESIEDDLKEDLEIPDNSIRNFRPPHLEFRIGNVILTHNMIPGIIVGWNIDI
ncbi:Beta-hexosaminidase, partial [Aphis craccivora]